VRETACALARLRRERLGARLRRRRSLAIDSVQGGLSRNSAHLFSFALHRISLVTEGDTHRRSLENSSLSPCTESLLAPSVTREIRCKARVPCTEGARRKRTHLFALLAREIRCTAFGEEGAQAVSRREIRCKRSPSAMKAHVSLTATQEKW